MVESAIERYRSWFEYEKDSHAKVLQSLKSTADDLQTDPAFQKAVDLLAHVITARRLWLYRLGVTEQGPLDLFPQNVPLSELATRLDEMQQAWSSYLNELTESDLDRVLEYQSLEGPRFRNKIEEILTQLFGHSLYHRGQIALLLRQIGAEPAATDYVFYTREAVEAI